MTASTVAALAALLLSPARGSSTAANGTGALADGPAGRPTDGSASQRHRGGGRDCARPSKRSPAASAPVSPSINVVIRSRGARRRLSRFAARRRYLASRTRWTSDASATDSRHALLPTPQPLEPARWAFSRRRSRQRENRVDFPLRGVAPRLIERLGAVVRDRQESLRLATISPHRERVREKLLQLARSHGRVRADGVWIALPLTHDLLARAVGASRETVTLAMRELRREGFLARSGRGYVLRVQAQALDQPSGASASELSADAPARI